jgi:hypothetical protein
MNPTWNNPDREPTHEELADQLEQLARLYRDHAPPEPAAPAWQSVLSGIEKRLAAQAVQPRWSARLRLFAGLIATAAALVTGVVLARALWPSPNDDAIVIVSVEEDEPFPVVTAGEVNIIRMNADDIDRVIVGEALLSPFEFAAADDIVVMDVEPNWDEGTMPRLERRSEVPMIVVARTDEES